MKCLFLQDIPRRKSTCFSGQEPLKAGMDYYSLLKEDDKGKWMRRDFCLACWEKFSEEKGESTFWKAKVQEEKKSLQAHLDRNDKALELLNESLKSPDALEESFILALYLARNKKLILRSQDKKVLIYEVLATEEILAISKIDLTSLQIEKLQKTLSHKFK